MLEYQHGLDQSGDTSGRIDVPQVALQRAKRTEVATVIAVAERLRERAYLDGIPEQGARSVGLDERQGRGLEARHREGLSDHAGLSGSARSCIADLIPAVVVHRGAADDRPHQVTIGHGIRQTLEHDHTGTVARHGPLRRGVERSAVAIGRENSAVFIDVAADERKMDRNAASKGHVALVGEQALTGHVHCYQRRGAGCAHAHAGST